MLDTHTQLQVHREPVILILYLRRHVVDNPQGILQVLHYFLSLGRSRFSLRPTIVHSLNTSFFYFWCLRFSLFSLKIFQNWSQNVEQHPTEQRNVERACDFWRVLNRKRNVCLALKVHRYLSNIVNSKRVSVIDLYRVNLPSRAASSVRTSPDAITGQK